MATIKTARDHDRDSWCELDNNTSARIVCGDASATPVPVSGSLSLTLSTAGPMKVTGASVTATSAAFPATNQTGRQALSIRNISLSDSIWIVNSTGISKATAGIDIWEVGPNESINTDFDDTNQIILVADAGKTVSIQILEIKA